MRALIALALALAAAPALADDLRDSAIHSQIADVGTTAVGLALGAAEANPLGILTVGVKVIAYNQIAAAPAVEQPRLWSAFAAFGWGAAANNLCVIAVIASGGAAAALCPVLGVAAGVAAWDADAQTRQRAEFDALCAAERQHNPSLECIFTPP